MSFTFIKPSYVLSFNSLTVVQSVVKNIPLIHLVNLYNLSNASLDYILGLSDKKDKIHEPIKLNKIKIGNNLKKIRISNNLTQKQFADSINTTQSVISSYESGNTLIQTSFLHDICLKYDVSANDIIK